MKAVLVVIAIALSPTVGRAEPGASAIREAEARFKKANALYKQGGYQQALLLYQAAYDLVPSPSILFNLGLTKEKVLDYEGCALLFEQYAKGGGVDSEAARTRGDACRARARIPVIVTSAPAGAAVYAGEGDSAKFLGRTPATLELAPASYRLRLELDGYVARSETVAVEIAARPRYDFVLEKLSTLHVEADVPDAQVTIGDGPAEAAPVERVIPAGSYRVRITKPGHVDVVRNLKVASGTDVQLAISLPPIPVRQLLSLSSIESAMLVVDGRAVGRGEASQYVQPGMHVVEASAPGHVSLRSELLVAAGQDTTATVHLPARRTRAQRGVLWGLGGIAVTAGVIGGVYGILSLADERAYADAPSRALRDEGLAHSRRADVFLASSLVIGGAALVSFLLTRPRSASLEVQH